MIKYTNFHSVGRLTLSTTGGARIGDCLREAMIIALTDDVEVQFTHNDVVYITSAARLIQGDYSYSVNGTVLDGKQDKGRGI